MSTFSFNSVDSSVYSLTGTPREPLLPEKIPSTIEISGRDGTYDFNTDSYRPKLIPVDCLVQASTEAALTTLKESISTWLSGSGWLIFSATPTKRRWAKVYSQVNINYIPLAAPFTVIFECQPYAEDVTETVGVLNTPTDYGSLSEFFPTITVTAKNYSNLITNGDFATVTTGWTAVVSVLTIDTGKLVSTGNGSSATFGAYQNTSHACVTGHKIYGRMSSSADDAASTYIILSVRGTTAGSSNAASQATPAAGTTYTQSGIVTLTDAFTGNVRLRINSTYADAGTANGKVLRSDNAFCLDLTDIFGAGNEPTLSEMDALIDAYLTAAEVAWFTGTAPTYIQADIASTGELVRIDHAFANDDEIVFDMSTGKTTVNATNHAVSLTSLYFGVPPGAQDISITSDGTIESTMSYRKRYLY